MGHYYSVKRIAAQTLGLIAALCGPVLASGPCRVPAYRVAERSAGTTGSVDVNISIRLEDFAPERLICLAGALKQAFSGQSVYAFIFSSYEAALHFLPGDLDLPPGYAEYQYKAHGTYVYDKGKSEEYVTIDPDGHRQFDPALLTRIDLPVGGTLACKVGINGRCLLEFEHIYYPSLEHRSCARGRVTLAGSILPDGTMAGVSVLSAQIDPPAQWALIVKFAAKNLKTWRFEPGEHKDTVRITYRFEGVHSPVVGNGTGVQFRLPYEVIVQAAP